MTSWDELQPRFRRAILQASRGGQTFRELAAEIPADRKTLWRMIQNRVVPCKALQAKAAEFVAGHLVPSDGDAAAE